MSAHPVFMAKMTSMMQQMTSEGAMDKWEKALWPFVLKASDQQVAEKLEILDNHTDDQLVEVVDRFAQTPFVQGIDPEDFDATKGLIDNLDVEQMVELLESISEPSAESKAHAG